MKEKHIIAIDGPAGSGKSTIARLVARRLGYLYIDTGAMYRALTHKALKLRLPLNNSEKLIMLAKETSIKLQTADSGLKVILDSRDVSRQIRSPLVTRSVVHVADIPEIREIMVGLQRKMGKKGGVVIEGRDTTTVVFPQAQKKFYLDASLSERLRRRYEQFLSEGKNVSKDELAHDIKARDAADKRRKVGALKKDKEAVILDTTRLSINEVVEKVLGYV